MLTLLKQALERPPTPHFRGLITAKLARVATVRGDGDRVALANLDAAHERPKPRPAVYLPVSVERELERVSIDASANRSKSAVSARVRDVHVHAERRNPSGLSHFQRDSAGDVRHALRGRGELDVRGGDFWRRGGTLAGTLVGVFGKNHAAVVSDGNARRDPRGAPRN
eukprot:CAMPEP_0119220364 /NCGR_PEP_ID=MMETSP1327-20130426/25693_1 /TAXON_ID=38833 /ORGANISM="Micromonas pusilla, Strain RCC2306" /LENGTH=167 /DNA_ID=CAMNT_0007218479 /DNA_START=69 /DNA_END=572 /DNA_ORIENTATION=+